jgi:hypothetical protein
MLYLVGIIHRDGGIEVDKNIEQIMDVFGQTGNYICFKYEIFARDNKEALTFYVHPFVSFISLLQGRRYERTSYD